MKKDDLPTPNSYPPTSAPESSSIPEKSEPIRSSPSSDQVSNIDGQYVTPPTEYINSPENTRTNTADLIVNSADLIDNVSSIFRKHACTSNPPQKTSITTPQRSDQMLPFTPNLNDDGNPPPGRFPATINSIQQQFCTNAHRRQLFTNFLKAVDNLKVVGVRRIWLAGSFTTSKPKPNDIDGAWEFNKSIDIHRIDPAFLNTDAPRKEMKRKFSVDFLIVHPLLVQNSEPTILDFFSIDRNNKKRGIYYIELT